MNKTEKDKASVYINALNSGESEIKQQRIKNDLFVLFDKHIENEAKNKAKIFYYQEEVLQKMYLKFFEAIEQYKNKENPLPNILNDLNEFKPDKEDIKPEFDRMTESIDKKAPTHSEATFADILTPKNLPVYASQASEEERKEAGEKFNKAIEDVELSPRELQVLNLESAGLKGKKLAKELGLSERHVKTLRAWGISKIQRQKEVLPDDIMQKAIDFKNTFELNMPDSKVQGIVTDPKTAPLKDYGFHKKNLEITAQGLGVDYRKYLDTVLKYPLHYFLLSYEPEKVFSNVEKVTEAFGFDRQKYIAAGLLQPQLFFQKPETLISNINKTAESLGVKQQVFANFALKRPMLFCVNPKTIIKKSNITEYYKRLQGKPCEDKMEYINLKTDEYLYSLILRHLINQNEHEAIGTVNLSSNLKSYLEAHPDKIYKFELIKNPMREDFIRFAEDYSVKTLGRQVFEFTITEKPQVEPNLSKYKGADLCSSVLKNKKTAKNHKKNKVISEETMQKAAEFKKIFGLETELLNVYEIVEGSDILKKNDLEEMKNDVDKTVKGLGVDYNKYLDSILKYPRTYFVLAVKSDKILSNVEKITETLGISRQKYIQAGLLQPQLFSQDPEQMQANIEDTAKGLGLEPKFYADKALLAPSLYFNDPVRIIKNAHKSAKGLGVPFDKYVDFVVNTPALLCLKPETLIKKANIVMYYKELQGKAVKDKLNCLVTKSDENLYSLILRHLINKNDHAKIGTVNLKSNLKSYLEGHPGKIYKFELPKNPLNKDFISFAQKYSVKTLGKQIFDFSDKI